MIGTGLGDRNSALPPLPVCVASTGVRGSICESVSIVAPGGPGGERLPWAKAVESWVLSVESSTSARLTTNGFGFLIKFPTKFNAKCLPTGLVEVAAANCGLGSGALRRAAPGKRQCDNEQGRFEVPLFSFLWLSYGC